jgi:ClpP class serine protease
MKKNKEEKILDRIKRLYQNYGIDILVMEEEEFKRVLEFYKSNTEKLAEDLKKSSSHANSFSDVDII